MKIFGRAPLVWLAALQSVLYLGVQIPQFHLTQTAADAVVVVASAAFTIWEAFSVKPVVVPTIVGAVRTVLVAVAAFGWNFSDEFVSGFGVALASVLALLIMPNATPNADPDPNFDTRSVVV